MKTRNGIFILALILGISGCSKDEPTATGGSVLPNSYLMPDSVGQSWHYNGYETILFYDTLGIRQDSTTSSQSMDITVLSRDTIEGYQTFTAEIHNYFPEDSNLTRDATGRMRYAQNDSLLAKVAYSFGVPIGLKQKGLRRVRFGGRIYNDIKELRNTILYGSGIQSKYDTTLITYDTPRVVLDYPLSIGKEWVQIDDTVLTINRKVEKKEQTFVNGQYCYCWKLKYLYDLDGDGTWDNDIVWYDWYNASGMVKRHMEISFEWTDLDGTILGTFIYIDHYELANP